MLETLRTEHLSTDLRGLIEDSELEYLTPANDYLIDGVYTREMLGLKDSIVVGAKHKKECINIISEGTVYVYNELTETPNKYEAPSVFVTSPGSRKIIYGLTDYVIINVFHTHKTTIKEAIKDCIVEDIETIHKEIKNRIKEKL